MNLTRFAVHHRTTTMAMVAVALLLGVQTFMSMPRREDPEITIRAAVVITNWPGATAEKIEELVTDPLESAISQMTEVHRITSQSKTGMSVITVDLTETIPQPGVDQAWDVMRAKIAGTRLPEGCGTPFVNSDFGDVSAVCMTLYQRPVDGASEVDPAHALSYRQLEVIAESIESDLQTIPSVAKVEILGIQEEVIYLEVPGGDWGKIDLTAQELAQMLDAQNIVASGGQLDAGGSRYAVRPTGEFEAWRAMGDVVVGRRDGMLPVFLRDLPIQVRRTTIDPPSPKYRFATSDTRAERALFIAVTMKSGANIVAMGSAIDERVRVLKGTTLPHDVELSLVNDLPRQVSSLIDNFINNLWQAILIVLGVALLMMGWRPALIMATAVPLSMVAAFTVVRSFGVDLEQFSIASLIIALGMIVDNAIVVSDNTVEAMKAGGKRLDAVVKGATSLAVPILTSTLTTVAAFIPMLTIVGNVGEYVRSLPIVVSATLLASYVVAMLVTPVMCYWLLPSSEGRKRGPGLLARLWKKIRRGGKAPAESKGSGGLYDRSIHWCLRHKAITLGAALAAVIASFQLIPLIGNDFFPAGDRDQFFVHVWLPEGSSIDATEAVCKEVEDVILASRETTIDGEPFDRLASITTLVGTGGPRLMLTSNPEQKFTNYAYMIVNTTDPALSASWVEELKPLAATISGADIDVRRFVLGPAVKNPVEIRLYAEDADLLREKAEDLMTIFNETPGALGPKSNWRNPSYDLEVRIDPAAANLAGITNRDVANTMSGLISGRMLTTYREGDHQIPVYLRIRGEERARLNDLSKLYVNGLAGKVPLASIATLVPAWQPSIICRRDRRRVLTVGSSVVNGYLPNDVSVAMTEKVEALVASMPPGSSWEFGGAMAESADSQEKLGGAFMLSAILILLVLITQYNSLVKPLIVLAAVPLALIGALIGLYVTGWALGFMPMLGIISLAGVVINNAIILIDFIEVGLKSGMPPQPGRCGRRTIAHEADPPHDVDHSGRHAAARIARRPHVGRHGVGCHLRARALDRTHAPRRAYALRGMHESARGQKLRLASGGVGQVLAVRFLGGLLS